MVWEVLTNYLVTVKFSQINQHFHFLHRFWATSWAMVEVRAIAVVGY